MSCIQEQPKEGVCPNARENGRIRPRAGVRITRGAGSGQHLASVLQEGRENANIDAGLGFIWRISDKRSTEWRLAKRSIFPMTPSQKVNPMNPSQKVHIPDEP